MPFFVALLLALFQALGPVPQAGARAGAHVYGVHVAQAASGAERVAGSSMRRSESRPLHESARAAAPVDGVAAARTEGRDGCPPTATTPIALGSLAGGAAFAAEVRARTLEASHAVATRGALLPYFPTAPPLQG